MLGQSSAFRMIWHTYVCTVDMAKEKTASIGCDATVVIDGFILVVLKFRKMQKLEAEADLYAIFACVTMRITMNESPIVC